jgi:hypothetical protein
MVKTTEEQMKVIKKYAKDNNLTIEKVVNYMISILEQEMEN